jgi:hypothetical protein
MSTFFLAVAASPAANLGPTPYLSFADSPLNGGAFTYFHLETFESGALVVPGVSVSSGAVVLGPSPLTDSVDADDGSIDGSGTGGHTLFSSGALSTFVFTFNAAALGGQLPTHVGIVWTDVGNAAGVNGVGAVTFEAFAPGNVSLGVSGPFILGDGSAAGGTAEDRFFGAINAGGIQSFQISVGNSTDWEVDHLQFGLAAVPESSTWLLAMAGVIGMCRRKLRGHGVPR